MIESKIVADSTNPVGVRITTFLLRYPRFIHSEFMTHRVFSRNAASSRAIPVKRIIQDIKDDPAMPVFWGAAQKGMQAAEELGQEDIDRCKEFWLGARDYNIDLAQRMVERGLHKQIANRILEPWAHMTTLATATDLGNFFNLRVHKDAQPEFQELARQMLVAREDSTPKELRFGEWHIPFGDRDLPQVKTECSYCQGTGLAPVYGPPDSVRDFPKPDYQACRICASLGSISVEMDIETKLKVCTARAARTSYQNFEGEIDIEKDIELHDRLKSSGHMSPFEHCAQAYYWGEDTYDHHPSNFDRSWMQYRKTIPKENQKEFKPESLLAGLR